MSRHFSMSMLAAVMVACGSLCVAAAAEAQGLAVVTGTVQGPDGARLPGALITARAGGAVVAEVASGEQGAFRLSGLRAGRFELRVELQGFKPAARTVDLAVAVRETVDVQLALDGLTETVTVVGSAARETLEPPRVRESGARDVGEAMSGMAGVWKVRRGAIANDIVVRGYQNDNVTVLIDGARLYGACPNNMDHTAFHVDFAEVDRIEIAKGPFDLRNQGGLGAAVNIVTKRPADGFHVNPQVSFGSYGYVNPSVTASYGTSRVAVLAGYSYRAANAYTDGSGRSLLSTANYRSTAADTRAFDVNTAWGRVDLAPGDGHALQVGYSRQRADDVLYPYLQMDAVYDNADRVNLGYDLKQGVGPIRSLRAQAYLTRVEHWMTDALRVSSNGMGAGYSMATLAKTSTQGGKVEASVPGGIVGVEAFRRAWDTTTQLAMTKYQPQASIPNVFLTSAGFYGEFSRAIGNALRVDVGGRLDRTRNEADASLANTALYLAYQGRSATTAVDTYPSGKIRVSYAIRPTLTLSGGVGRTVRVPDPQERYFGLKRSGSDWVGNPFLRPTKNTGVEMNLAYRVGRLFLNGNVHRDALADAIGVYQQAKLVPVAGVMNTVARSYRNVDATMSGAEVEGVLPVTDRLFLSGDVSTVRGRQTVNAAAGVNSPWLSEMPPTRSRLALRYEARGARRSGFAEVEAVYSAQQTHVDTDLRESPTPSYAVANARLGASLGKVRVAVGVANIFNRTYVEHLSYQRDPFRTGTKTYEPGRNVYTNVALAF
jgi:iron complex outermembrane receptor protein